MKQRYPEHTQNGAELQGEVGVTVDLCEDCIMGDAGYETPEAEYEICREWDGWVFGSVEDEHGEVPQHFSKSACDGCHSTLWGTRYEYRAVFVATTN